MFLRFHLLTWLLYVAIVSVEEVTTFSGYSTVYSMLGGATKRTDKHFKTRGEVIFHLALMLGKTDRARETLRCGAC